MPTNQNREDHAELAIKGDEKGKAKSVEKNNRNISMATIFKDPKILFPKTVGPISDMEGGYRGVGDVNMGEDMPTEIDVISGIKKGRRMGESTMRSISILELPMDNPRAVLTLRDLLRTYQPDVIFLCETLVHANKIEEIRVRLGFDASFAVDRIGRSGGLAQPYECQMLNYSTNFINVEVVHEGSPIWHFSGFYSFPDRRRRRKSWNLLGTLARDNSLPWCVMGDYNELLSNDDKKGNADHPPWLIRGFRETVMECSLHDLPMEGYQFTWT